MLMPKDNLIQYSLAETRNERACATTPKDEGEKINDVTNS